MASTDNTSNGNNLNNLNYFQKLAAKILNIPVSVKTVKKTPAPPTNLFGEYLSNMGQGTSFTPSLDTLHRLYDMMDKGSLELSTYLDTLSEECTFSPDGETLMLEGSYHDITGLLEEAIERWDLRKKLPEYARLLAKYGRLVVKPKYAYVNNKPYILKLEDGLDTPTPDVLSAYIVKDFDDDGNWIGWEDTRTDEKHPIYAFVEFKLGSTLWGRSLLFGLEDYWPELNLLEKNLDLYRAGRPPLFVIHRLPVSNLDPVEYSNVVNWAKYFIELSRRIISPSGQEQQTPNTGSAIQSLFYPQTEVSREPLQILENNPNIKDIKDIEYKRSKLLGKLALPESYVTGKDLEFTTLSGYDPRILRRVIYLQRELLRGIDILLQLELALLNVQVKKDTYTLKMPRNLDVLELRNLDKTRVVLDIYESMKDMASDLGYDQETWNKFLVQDFVSYYFGDLVSRFDQYQKPDYKHTLRYTEHRINLGTKKITSTMMEQFKKKSSNNSR